MKTSHFVSWNAAIWTQASSRHTDALLTFLHMHRAGLHPDPFALATVIKSSSAFLPGPSSIHAFAAKTGLVATSPAAKALMDSYVRSGAVCDAHQVFDRMGHRDTVSWNIMLSGLARLNRLSEAMGMFYSMCFEVRPSDVSVAVVLPVCARLRALRPAESVHGYATKTGLVQEKLVGNALVSVYAKCGLLMDGAWRVFSAIDYKDVVSWNSMIAGCAENGFVEEAFGLFFRMVAEGGCVNYATIVSVLPLCGFFQDGWYWGKAIHCHVLRFGLETDVSVGNALVTHYARVGDLKGADDVFGKMNVRDVVSWNSLIAGHALNGSQVRALALFRELLLTGIEPDSVTFVSALPVCAQLCEAQEGRKIHDYVSKDHVLSRDTTVQNALVSFYGKLAELDDALHTFVRIPRRDLVSWNAMLTAYADNEKWEELIGFFRHMIEEGTLPDPITILNVLQACPSFSTRMVREVHGYSIRAGFMNVSTVGNAVLNAYAKCRSIDSASKTFESLSQRNVVSDNTMISLLGNHGFWREAEDVFDRMQERDLGTWNLMVQAYAQNDCLDQAVSLFQGLQHQGLRPDAVSIVSILPACTRLASVQLVRQCHGYMIRALLEEPHLKGALLDTYAKCGSINNAHKLFKMNPHNDIVMFTAMIGGFAMNGMTEEALRVFSQMLDLGIKPDHVTMTALLSACSHAGLIDEGWKHFKSINEIHGIKYTMEHYACLADVLARRGQLKEAHAFIKSMPCEANASVWGTLLGACKIHGEVEIGQLAAENLFNVEAGNIGNYIVMSNIYAADGKWDGVEEVRRLMKSKELTKPAGCSWVEVEKTRHIFVAGDISHPQRSIVDLMLKTLDKQIKEPLGPEDL